MPISRIHWFRAQLQAQLQRRLRDNSTSPLDEPLATTAGSLRTASNVPMRRLNALRSRQVIDEQVQVTALLEDLLGESLGAGMENDPEYHQAISAVLIDLRNDPELWALCLRAVAES